MAKHTKPRRRYGIIYFTVIDNKVDWSYPDAWGSTEHLINAYGLAARHVARSDKDRKEYKRAAIYDRHKSKLIRVYERDEHGIKIKDL